MGGNRRRQQRVLKRSPVWMLLLASLLSRWRLRLRMMRATRRRCPLWCARIGCWRRRCARSWTSPPTPVRRKAKWKSSRYEHSWLWVQLSGLLSTVRSVVLVHRLWPFSADCVRERAQSLPQGRRHRPAPPGSGGCRQARRQCALYVALQWVQLPSCTLLLSCDPYYYSLPPLAVGDGGFQWRLRKLKRAQEQAQEESRTLEDVWLERNGVRSPFRKAKIICRHQH